MRLAAYDPGENTGWAWCDYEDGVIDNLKYGWGLYWRVAIELYNEMRSTTPFDVVIYETWRLRKDKARHFYGSPIIPIQAVGLTKAAVLFTSPKVPLIGQEPAIKPVVDRHMAGFGAHNYLPPADGAEHARDAVRHLYHYHIQKEGYRP